MARRLGIWIKALLCVLYPIYSSQNTRTKYEGINDSRNIKKSLIRLSGTPSVLQVVHASCRIAVMDEKLANTFEGRH